MNYNKLIFFDIETVGKYRDVDELKKSDKRLYKLLEKKFKNTGDKERWESGTIEEMYFRMSPIIPEYGKIVCISLGYDDDDGKWIITSLTGEESDILNNVQKIFLKSGKAGYVPCGYNVILFDLPWINKKMIKHGIRIPYNIQLLDKKPWNTGILDLSDSWRTTGRYWSSLDEVTYELGLTSPKDELSGDKVHDTYWNKNDISKIAKYCEGDVFALKETWDKISKCITI
jgi:hypothetical protein